ncbi:MAG: hypothetical protein NXI18_22090 [Alphaproteobacteria bacterium]|nr:hypothetical protein [Alphaproteobacteria bacterium]
MRSSHLAQRLQIAKTTAKEPRVLTEREYHARLAIAQIERRLHAFDADRARSGRTTAPARRLRTALGSLGGYINGQSSYLVDFAGRQRAGQPVGTSTSEGLATVLANWRMNRLQQMRWSTAGAHAIVTLRAKSMNDA